MGTRQSARRRRGLRAWPSRGDLSCLMSALTLYAWLIASASPVWSSTSTSTNYGIRGTFGTSGSESNSSSNYRVRASSPTEPAFVAPAEGDASPLDEVDNLSSSEYAIIPGFIGSLIDLVAAAVGLNAPDLLAFGGVTLGTHKPVLDWNDVSGALTYRVEIDVSSAFTDPNVYAGVAASELAPDMVFAEGLYYWRVKAFGSGSQESNFSAADSFRIVPALAVWLILLLAAGMAVHMVRRRRTASLSGRTGSE